MKLGWGWTLVWGVLFAAGLIAPSRRALAGNCALYARAETGVALYGDAGGWWDEAAGRYERGHVPEIGSILVFRRSGFMPAGHVAIVSKVIGPGQILVDQSNWYHGRVTHDTPVIDTSPEQDWSQVAVMNIGSGEFGRDSPTYGFVYPDTGAQGIVAMSAAPGFDPNLAASRAAYQPGVGDLLHFAVNDDGWHARLRYDDPADSRHRRRYSRRRERRSMPRAGEDLRSRSAHPSAQHASYLRATHAFAAKRDWVAGGHRFA
jgi:CHAP domain